MTLFEKIFGKSKRAAHRRINTLNERSAIANTMTADRLSDIIASAENGDMRDLFDLYRDIIVSHGHTGTEFSKRKIAVLTDQVRFIANDPDNIREVAMRDWLSQSLPNIPGWQDSMIHLLDSTLYPLSIVEKIYKPSSIPGVRFELKELIPVPYRLIDYSTGRPRVENTDESGHCLGTYNELSSFRYIVHRGHLFRSIPDTWGGPMRSLLFWWLFSVMGRDWWARFLERFGSPFLEGSYDEGDEDSRYLLERAFNAATKIFGIVAPADTMIKVHQVNTNGAGDAFSAFHTTANDEISKIILGQTLSAKSESLGFDSGQAQGHEAVREDIRQFDANQLAATVKTQIIDPLYRANAFTSAPCSVAWGGSDHDQISISADTMTSATSANLELTDEGLQTYNKITGLEFRRKESAPLALSSLSSREPVATPSDARTAIDSIASKSAPGLASALADQLSAVRAAVLDAKSTSDLEERLGRILPTIDHGPAAKLTEEALAGSAVNALL